MGCPCPPSENDTLTVPILLSSEWRHLLQDLRASSVAWRPLSAGGHGVDLVLIVLVIVDSRLVEGVVMVVVR